MTSSTSITKQNLDAISAADLRKVAEQVLETSPALEHLNPTVTLYRAQDEQGRTIETLVVGDRAGQFAGGDCAWGTWSAATQTIRMDEPGPDGETVMVGLSGRQQVRLTGGDTWERGEGGGWTLVGRAQ